MATGMRYERLASGQIWRRYERSTGETVEVFAPVNFKDDFFASSTVDDTPGPWGVSEATATCDTLADQSGGQVLCDMTTADGDEKAILYGANNTCYNLGITTTSKYFQFETRVMITDVGTTLAGHHFFMGVGETLTADLTGANYLYGTAADVFHGFYVGANYTNSAETTGEVTNLFCLSDDGAGTNDNAVDSGTDIVQNQWYIFRVDFSEKANVKFYVDGDRIAAGTTFSITGSTTTDCMVQPVIGCYKHTAEGNAGGGQMYIDYVRCWGIR